MKKNLFVLFSIYFFVVQPIFVWLLRQEPNMLILAVINLVAILIILLLSKAMDGGKAEKPVKEAHQHKEAIHEEKETLFQPHHHEPIVKKGKKGGAWKGMLGVILGIICYILFMGSAIGFKLIGASIIALVLLFLVCLFTRSLRKFFSLAGTKILLAFLALGIIVFIYQFAFFTTSTSLKGYIIQNVTSSRVLFGSTATSDAYMLSGEGSVIGSGITSWDTASNDIINLFSGMQDGNSDVVTGNTTTDVWNTTTTNTTTTTVSPTGTSLHMGEMIKALVTKYSIPLVTKKDVKFANVSYTNELYPYFRTAYASTLIGTTTSPVKLALCNTLIVMKGILEKWPVTYTTANVMQKYRDYAVANDKLNGCVKGAVVKDTNL